MLSQDPVATSQPVMVRLEIPGENRYLNVVGACAAAFVGRAPGVKEPEILNYNIELALQEVCTNIVMHAYAGQTGRIVVEFGYDEKGRQLTVDIYDTGRPFDPAGIAEPPLGEAQVHGYGLFLIRSLMDDVSYDATPGVNHWRLAKRLE